MTAPSPPGAGPVQLRFTALPEHVRTARLVTTAVARRTGLDDTALEGVRLAVGEACSRAVQRTEASTASGGGADLVALDLRLEGGALVVEVRDGAGAEDVAGDDVGLLLMEGLADAVAVTDGAGGPGGCVRLTWRLPPSSS
ncbi:ATP-binding protein [Quadrisphaera sp. DSM 44207]|uniref:ATP-binding protein n=1 Tax=Quadrisphaera sp. DSM 44207 TaxID=1881057 RepID=UPI000889F5B7|nr:ATP-binding protein [Quadrisphaera sp. DSM 44207]SDQ17643.1 Anti-sigma regulatory factor (Ser/Thr protein kinase) [Quadrisphaera sp. DSM 44207]